MNNELLLDVEVFPDHGQIVISDVGGHGATSDGGLEYGLWFSEHTVSVITMSADEADYRDKGVQVRVYRGSDATELGTLVFDRNLIFTDPPQLGVYELLWDEPEEGGAIPIERTGPVRIQIFVDPPQEADHVNVLIRYDIPTPEMN
ncbi:hypothetical protein BVC93_11855 [Mycobacterium sp. MS1601]|uniref:hypothetical protein n=1 Tax=Mycobacterium sp. MS1601 TaxID=1936029 RepID=UPI0009796EE5|nr:hypothetical protein [Mycobacterium sp. MS1601]AQA03013.1 hypothetical protein BVC93_11855 [Mycobacterium sp. MS1601]